jgi:hypothetical protein
MHKVYKNIIHRYLNYLEKSQEPPNILEDELPGDSIERTLTFLGNSIGKIQEYQENIHGGSTKEPFSCHDALLPSPPIPSMDLQDSRKGKVIQRRRQLHKIPLNLPEVDFHMPDIPIEKIYTFFGNTSKDVEKHLFRFKITCDVFNINEAIVTCQLFFKKLCGDALEWYNSLLPETIASWDVLETSFAENFIPRVHSYDFC